MVVNARLDWSFWLVSSVIRLRITSRLHRATGWSALARDCDEPRHSVDGVVFDAILHTVIIGRSHSQGSGRRLAIDLIILYRS